MSTVNNRVNPDPVLQVDANAIAANCTSGLLIPPVMFLRHMIAPSISSVFTGSSQSDFIVNEDNLSVTNTKTVTWANVKLEDNSTVQLSVDKDNLSMGVQNDRITMEFSNLNYPLTALGFTVGHTEIIFSGQFQLVLTTGTNGNPTLWFDIPSDQPNITDVTSIMNQTFFTIEAILGGLTIGLSLLGIGGIFGARIATKAATKALVEAGEVEANATAAEAKAAFQELLESPAAKRAFIGEGENEALVKLSQATIQVNKAYIWTSVAVWSGITATITRALTGEMLLVESTLEDAA